MKAPLGMWDKTNLKKNIEKIFKVNVTKINIINKQNRVKITRGKKVRVSGFKKAIWPEYLPNLLSKLENKALCRRL